MAYVPLSSVAILHKGRLAAESDTLCLKNHFRVQQNIPQYATITGKDPGAAM